MCVAVCRCGQVLYLNVMNHRLTGDVVLGTLALPVFPFVALGGHVLQGWLPLVSDGDSGGVLGQVHVTLQILPDGVSSKDQRAELQSDRDVCLVVRVRSAKDVKDVEVLGKLDPFVEVDVPEAGVNAKVSRPHCVQEVCTIFAEAALLH